MYFTYDGLSLSTPSIVTRFGCPLSFQVTSTAARPLGAHATVTSVGGGSEAQAVSEVAPATTTSPTASTRRIPTTPRLLTTNRVNHTQSRVPFPYGRCRIGIAHLP